MKVGEQVSVTITAGERKGKTLRLDVEEFQPIESSAYAWTAGWNCAVEIAGESVWFFVDEAGIVYDEANDSVGICPEQEREYERMVERENEIVVGCEGCGGYVERPDTHCNNCRLNEASAREEKRLKWQPHTGATRFM